MPTPEQLIIEMEYFKKAIPAWEGFSTTLSAGLGTARDAGLISPILGNLGALNDVITAVNRLAITIRADLLAEGIDHTQQVADNLRQIARDYVIAEAENADLVAQLEGMLP